VDARWPWWEKEAWRQSLKQELIAQKAKSTRKKRRNGGGGEMARVMD
jgi:hypothetical protein